MTTKVQSEFIADSSVTTAKLGDTAVTTAKLADDAVTTAKLGNITTIASSGDITLDAAGDIILDADGDDIKFAEGGTVVMEIKHENTGVNFHLNTTDEDYKFRGSDGGSTITALQLDISDAGTAIFNNKVVVDTLELVPDGSEDLINSTGSVLRVKAAEYSFKTTNGTERFRINQSGRVGIGDSADTLLHIKNEQDIEVRLEADSNNNGQEDCFIRFYTDGKTQEGIVGMDNNNGSTLFNSNTENAMVFGTVSNLPTVFATNDTERLHISAAGNVGIGTSSPDDKLDIMGGGYDQIRIGSNKTNNTNKTAGIVSTTYANNSVSFFQGYFQNGDNSVYYGSADGAHRGIQNHYFYVNTSSTATSGHALAYQISSAGGHKHKFLTSANSNSTKVQIHNGEGLWVYNNGGSSYSSYGLGSALRVAELSVSQAATHYIEISGNLPGYSNGQYNCLKTSLNDLHFAAGNTYTGYISYNTGFNDISDLREKENITTITNATDKLKQLRGVYHTWKDTANRGSDTQMGLIAQEVEAVVPEVVTTSNPTSLQTGEEDTAGLKGVSYGKLVPLLIETIKELEARIKILEG